MMSQRFDPDDADLWLGGYYEAAMLLGPGGTRGADDRLRRAIATLWSHPALTLAAVGDRKSWNWDSSGFAGSPPLDALERAYGAFAHPSLGLLPFTTVTVREDGGDDWLDACVPLGGIRQSGGYPFGDAEYLAASRSWREPLERSLADLVLNVSRAVGIQVAAIGFETSGTDFEPSRLAAGAARYVSYVVPRNGAFTYLPTTHWV